MSARVPTEQMSSWAVAALVFGLAGLAVAVTSFALPILPSVLAIVCAQRARRELRRSRGRRRGRAYATAGWWLGWIGIVERILVAILVEQEEPWFLMIFAGIAFVAVLFTRGGKADLKEHPTPPWIA